MAGLRQCRCGQVLFAQHVCEYTNIAALLRRAADELGEEAVMYSLGLHPDHAESFDTETLTDSRGNQHMVEIPISEEEGDRRKQEEIDAHLAFVAELRAAADLLS